jgi:hypothetical protein
MKNNKGILKDSTLIFLISSGISAFSTFWVYRDLLNMDDVRVVENFPYIKIGIIISLISCLTGTIYSLLHKLNEIQFKIKKIQLLIYEKLKKKALSNI